MKLPAPRIIVVDDRPEHLRGLADGLNEYGAACLQVQFTGDLALVKECPYVRVIFADLHLTEGGALAGHEQHFAVIGGLIEAAIRPSGPYLLVLWTRYADQASALKMFLDGRLQGVAKPFAVVPLDKNIHLDEKGRVKDVRKLVAAIGGIIADEPQIAALLNWEERVMGAAADTVSALLEAGWIPQDKETASGHLRRLLYHLASAAVGKGHVFEDRFHAVNEALLPILADRIAVLKAKDGQNDPWNDAILEADAGSPLSVEEAAQLNRLSHIADGTGVTGAARGAVIALPGNMAAQNFAGVFGISPPDSAEKEFRCKDFADNDGRFRWVLIQVQAACDYAQGNAGPLPFVLALEMPEDCVPGRKGPDALWESPAFLREGVVKVLHANSRFQVTLADAAAKGVPALYRIREQLLNELVYDLHTYGARPGHISFHEVKLKGNPTAGAQKGASVQRVQTAPEKGTTAPAKESH